MSMIMNHDITSLMGQRIMMRNSLAMKRSLEKLSTGLRTKIADVDNTAGLAISETMRSRIFGMEKALYNTQDGISLIQTASGALEQTNSMLMRMRELSVQAANDVLTQQDRSYIQVEINEIRDEITRLANTTQFNRKKILSGDNAVLWSSTDKQVKAVINGGIRSIDQFGQKYALDGNYKISVKAQAGQAQTQKSNILKIKHEDSISDKSLNTSAGVKNVEANSIPAGTYSLTLAEAQASEAIITGSQGVGGTYTTESIAATFNDVNIPVNKITISTNDGVEIWSTNSANIFGTDSADAATQAAYFNGGTDSNGQNWAGVLDEIKNSASQKGITITGDDITSLTLTSGGANPRGLKISYEGEGVINSPASEITSTSTNNISAENVFTVESSSGLKDNASILFEVKSVDSVNGLVTLSASANILSQDGTSYKSSIDNILLTDGGESVNLGSMFGNDSLTVGLNGISYVQEGAKFVVNVSAQDLGSDVIGVNISGTGNSQDPNGWTGSPFNGNTLNYILNGSNNNNKEIRFNNYFLNSRSGEVTEGTITLSTGLEFKSAASGGQLDTSNETSLASFKAAYTGRIADKNTQLRDIDKFWDSEGNYLLQQPQELTLTQGDGTQARVMIYGNDTVNDLVKKLNTAVAVGLGQAKYVDDAGKFVTFTEGAKTGAESVAGTLVIRSALTGSKGEISISGSEELLNALSLNTIRESKESTYNIDVIDAHDGAIIAQNVNITGNRLVGVVHKNVDVEFDSMMGLQAAWSESTGNYSITSTTGNSGTDIVLHLADNTMIFQTGAGEGEDVILSLGDMSSDALGLNGVNVMSRERAAKSLDLIDKAIDKVSMQQAKLGAAQNRLEHHLGNLTDETEALISANSRIRDTDYASELLEYTKMQILMQANSAMLAQSNQLQTNTILSILR
ncbi:MAG: flagellin [Synergistaceae bacterium]|nr:flagellin [Synergistaceae bacterium]